MSRRKRLLGGATLALGLVSLVSAQACMGRGMYTRPETGTCTDCAASADQLDHRVVLIGDTGEDLGDTPVLRELTRVSSMDPARTTVLFLGDNVYPLGLPPPDPDTEGTEPPPACEWPEPDLALLETERQQAERILAAQICAMERSGAEAVFLPGNHDWARKRPTGMARMIAQQQFVGEVASDPERIRVLPRGACPGPMILDRGQSVRIVLIDSVWLFEQDDPRGQQCEWGVPGAEEALPNPDNDDVYRLLSEAVGGAGQRRVLYAAHHPLKTRGPHGGHVTFTDWVFPFTYLRSWLYLPLPILYPIVRYGIVKTDEDLVGQRNQRMVQEVERALSSAGSQTVTAGGHEHSLQVFDDPRTSITYLVSGAGAKSTPVGKTDETVFKQYGVGFMVLDYFRDGRVSLRVIGAEGEGEYPSVVFSSWIE